MDISKLAYPIRLTDFSIKYKSVLVVLLIVSLSVDTMLSNTSDVYGELLSSQQGAALFIVLILMIYGSGYSLLVGHSRKVCAQIISKKKNMSYLYQCLTISQCVLIVILSAMFIQIMIYSEYHIILLVAVTAIGYTLSAMVMGILTYYMSIWYRLNPRNLVLLLFALSAGMTALASLNGGLSQNGLILQTGISVVHPDTIVVYPTISPYPSQLLGELYSISLIATMLAYGLTWGASALLLYNYSKSIGMIRYLIIISLPMGSFLFGITPILLQLPSTSTYFDPSLLVFRILSISALIAVGVLFGVSFLTTVRALRRTTKNLTVDYLFIATYGISSLFISLAANIAHGAYPPFGITTYGFTAVASYFFMLGIYSSALSVSADTNLRRAIRKSVMEQSFLDSIGTAQMEHEIQKKTLKIMNDSASDPRRDSGIEPELSDQKLKEYMDEVLQEVKKRRAL
jgi:hypothetical protein